MQTNEPRGVKIEGRKASYLKSADPVRLVELLSPFTIVPALEVWANSGRRFTTQHRTKEKAPRLKALGGGLLGVVLATNAEMLHTRTLQIFELEESERKLRPMINIIARTKPADRYGDMPDLGPRHYNMFIDHADEQLPLYYRVARQGHYELFAYMSEVFMNKEPPIVKIFPDEDPETVLMDVLARLDGQPILREADSVCRVPAVPDVKYKHGKTKEREQPTFWT